MHLQKNISFYNGAIITKENPGKAVDIDFILQTIAGRTGESALLQQKIERLRKMNADLQELKNNKATEILIKGKEEECDDFKIHLPAVTWSGLFGKLKGGDIKEYSQLICADIDKLTDNELKELSSKLITDPHVFSFFVSPRGHGLKIIFSIAGTPLEFKDYFYTLETYFKSKYGKDIDQSCKNINRLCFLSYDENIFINREPISLPVLVTEKEKREIKKIINQASGNVETFANDLTKIWQAVEKRIPYAEGSRNRFLYAFCCFCNRGGVAMSDCFDFVKLNMSDRTASEISQSVENAYNNNQSEFGIYAKKNKRESKVVELVSYSGEDTPTDKRQGKKTDKATDDFIKFWNEFEVEKGRGEKKYKIKRYQLRRTLFSKFLYKEGFHLLLSGKDGFEMCHSAAGVVAPVDPHKIKQYVLKWCMERDLDEIEEMLRTGQKQYFAVNELDSLQYKEIEIKTDTADQSYFYFRNCWVTVTNDGNITTHPYTELGQWIWASNKIPYDFKTDEPNLFDNNNHALPYKEMDCEFAQFVSLVSWNPENEEEKSFEKDTITQRFKSFCSCIGYLLDAYKHPAFRKGIFAIDHKVGDKGEQHGRTGKSMIPKACELMKRVASISGKRFDPKYQFCLEPITMDSQIVNFNDMPRNFDVESIFEVIADDYTVNRKSNSLLHFSYYKSPKAYVSSNFIPRGEGESYAGRMHIIEFSDYFNSRHTPYDEFGHSMYSDWKENEMSKFFNFMLYCVALYKAQGLIDYPKPNFDARKLINEVVSEFVDFMDNDFPKNEAVKKMDMIAKYNETHQNLYGQKLKPHTFVKWIKQYCKNKDFKFNPQKNGGYDKRNGIEYYTVADAAYKSTQQSLL